MARVVQSVMDFMYPYTNCMLALTSLGFAASLPDVVRNQVLFWPDAKLVNNSNQRCASQ